MRIAVINTGSPSNRKGAFNNVHERIKHLRNVKDVNVDVFLIRHYDSWMFSLLRNRREQKEESTSIDGISYRNLWVKHKLLNYILTFKLKLKGISSISQLSQFVPLFKCYDLLSVHVLPDMYLAFLVKEKYGIPFVTTWHGSDINVWPFVNKKGFQITKSILENADHNFFVSKKLLKVSDQITNTGSKSHLYSGPSDIYFEASKLSKSQLRGKLKLTSKYLVGFIGNLVPIKNVMVLPDIFRKIQEKVQNVGFIVVGDGELMKDVKLKMSSLDISNLTFTGNLSPEDIPQIMHSLDLLVLPSLNEGMPRVTLEALACGVNVVGSDVGGIPESIGENNCFSLDKDFVEKISNRAIEILLNDRKPFPYPEEFTWVKTIEKELAAYRTVLNFK